MVEFPFSLKPKVSEQMELSNNKSLIARPFLHLSLDFSGVIHTSRVMRHFVSFVESLSEVEQVRGKELVKWTVTPSPSLTVYPKESAWNMKKNSKTCFYYHVNVHCIRKGHFEKDILLIKMQPTWIPARNCELLLCNVVFPDVAFFIVMEHETLKWKAIFLIVIENYLDWHLQEFINNTNTHITLKLRL